jgi:hypothetical protein
MSGGPSQLDTFDLKPGNLNGGPFRPIDTSAKGVQISEHLPKLAKLGNHLTIIRSVTHREGDHARATHLMQSGYLHDGQTQYPSLAAILGKELGGERPDVPRYVSILPLRVIAAEAQGPGFLGPKYAPLPVGGPGELPAPPAPGQRLKLPPLEVFQKLDADRAEALRKAVAPAFDLGQEKDAVRDAYGRNPFGEGCLLARRLVEHGVPVVQVTMGGWDTHQDNFNLVEKQSGRLDDAWATLLTELRERKLLGSTLVLWMGEFGRTPRINPQDGRDHWPLSFCAVLAGRGLKGGQVVGKTNDDGTLITDRPVTPPELLATVYQALGVDLTRQNRSNTGRQVRILEEGTQPVKEALRK